MIGRRDIFVAISILGAIATIVLFFYSFIDSYVMNRFKIDMLMAIALGVALSAWVSYFARIIYKKPAPITIALLGPPNSGKTVYLTVLFDQLPNHSESGIAFQPYGRETIEKVHENLNTLLKREWLPKTPIGDVFGFRANARVTRGILPRKYTISIPDFAGENIDSFDSKSDKWLHKGDFFKEIISADAILFMVDAEYIIAISDYELNSMLLSLRAALQVLIVEKGVAAGEKLKLPIGIVITKSDLLIKHDITTEQAEARIDRFVEFSKNNCSRLQLFFVSSVGEIDEKGRPTVPIKPVAVIQPIVWAIFKIKT